ncbi:MAG: VCBS repeat-containing protein [Blastocatellia bacterium]|nr:VCBS repeat-containing protein [Blastocatellia bacterium]
MKTPTIVILFVVFAFVSVSALVVWKGSLFPAQTDNLATSESPLTPTSKRKGPKGDGPGLAHEWRRLAWKDQNGSVALNGRSAALSQRDAHLAQQKVGERYVPGAISNLVWTSRGPQNVGGRTRSLIVHPSNSNILWAGAVSGGVWKSVDAGQTWIPPNGSLTNFAVSSMAIDPNNPNILYAGTGEGFFNGDGLQGAGLFKSVDGGLNWAVLESTVPDPQNAYHWGRIDRLSVAHDDSNKILAATGTAIYRTTNGGASWTPVRDRKSLYVAFAPNNSSKAIAEVNENDVHKALYSTNGGASWSSALLDGNPFEIQGWLSRIELAYSKSDPNIVYAAFKNTSVQGEPVVICRSTDGGQTFVSKASQTNIPAGLGVSWYNNTIWVSPSNSNFVIVGGGSENLHRSTDGGDNFVQIADGSMISSNPHPDEHCIVPDSGFNGTTNKTVYVCNDGGIYKTTDITTASANGSGWTQLNSSYQTTQYYGAAGNGDSEIIYGGTQDNATLRLKPDSQNAIFTYGGDGGFSAVDPLDSNYCYGEHIGLRIHRVINCTSSSLQWFDAKDIHNGISDVSNGYTSFISPFVLDMSSPNRMLAGGASLWRTSNVRGNGNPNDQPTWTNIKSNSSNTRISAIAISPSNSDFVWISERNDNGGDEGRIYKTSNATTGSVSWTTVDDNGSSNPLPNRYVTRILIDKTDSAKVYVAFGGFTDGNLWKTSNGGSTWQDITGTGLPNVPIRGIAQHPNNSSKLYIGTEIGVFTSDNDGATWAPVLSGPANVSVDEVSFMSNSTYLLAATHGRGIWVTDVDVSTTNNTAPYDFDGDNKTDLSVFRPTPAEWWYTRSSDNGSAAFQFGIATDVLVPGDFSGDNRADVAIWRPSNGTWYVLRSEDVTFFAFPFGSNGDVPAPADFDGDNIYDAAVFRPSTATWYISNSSNESTTFRQFGLSTDRPVPADFDADGHADLAIFRPSVSEWWVLQQLGTEQENLLAFQFGTAGDKTVHGDYTGDGKADAAIFRPSNGYWYIQRSEDFSYYSVPFGTTGDIPAPGDYDGDGKFDTAVFRPSNATWYAQRTTAGTLIQQFGLSSDVPVPNAYVR